jgi:hypothetical protein
MMLWLIIFGAFTGAIIGLLWNISRKMDKPKEV